jgi:hypothetical protein
MSPMPLFPIPHSLYAILLSTMFVAMTCCYGPHLAVAARLALGWRCRTGIIAEDECVGTESVQRLPHLRQQWLAVVTLALNTLANFTMTWPRPSSPTTSTCLPRCVEPVPPHGVSGGAAAPCVGVI